MVEPIRAALQDGSSVTDLFMRDADECTLARELPTVVFGDSPQYVQVTGGCDDSDGGAIYAWTVVGPAPDVGLIVGVQRWQLCARGVDLESGLCV